MTMITIPTAEITLATNLKKERILEGLNNLGAPSEEKEKNIVIEVSPNRPDFFSIEGIARALNCFYGKKPFSYTVKQSQYFVKLSPTIGISRPYIVAAVVKNIQMNESALKSLIQLQEKLHETLGRKRAKLAVGVHNLDMVSFPLTYKFVSNESFVPLDFDSEMSISEILDKHPKGRCYNHLLKNDYPMLYDQKGVISFPPIINAERTRVKENTKNLLIEITGTNLNLLSRVLNIIACALADRKGEIYKLKVGKEVYPKISPEKLNINFKSINKLLGVNFDKKQIFTYLTKLGWLHDGKKTAYIPPYRIDISHYVDVAEDIAIAHGYNAFEFTLPNFFIPGSLAYSNEDIRQGMIGLGFIETVNYALTNQEKLNYTDALAKPIKIINPKTTEFTLLRTNLVSSLFENLIVNKTHLLPIRIFELGRVYNDKEEIHLAFALSAEIVDFTKIKSVFQILSTILGKDFELKKSENKLFFPGRGADIFYNKIKVGMIGEVSPLILEKFGIENPVGVCEINISKI